MKLLVDINIFLEIILEQDKAADAQVIDFPSQDLTLNYIYVHKGQNYGILKSRYKP